MLRYKIARDTLLLNAGSVVSQGLMMLQALLIMRLLDPGVYGVWLGLNILLTYGAYANLGLEYGLGVRLPYYSGQGNREREGQVEDTVYVGWIVNAFSFSLGRYHPFRR